MYSAHPRLQADGGDLPLFGTPVCGGLWLVMMVVQHQLHVPPDDMIVGWALMTREAAEHARMVPLLHLSQRSRQ
jgi:hypothetical protein